MRGTVAFSGKVGGVQSSRFSGGRDTVEDFILGGTVAYELFTRRFSVGGGVL